MIIARDEPYAPEKEAARENENVHFFTADSISSLGNELIYFSDHAQDWYNKRHEISRDCRNLYSAEGMASAFILATVGEFYSTNDV